MTRLTAETITDEQIRELHQRLLEEDMRNVIGADVRDCRIALEHYPNMTAKRVGAARARCAEILSARSRA